ncbi:MAG: hypothetical protein CL424_20240 [Acidimicrobiaceae bacterium]|nr:hypothetical protein [Acidimicrobiaceae bacterium]
MQKKITVADIIMLVGGAVAFLFSFLKFASGRGAPNAWDTDFFAFATTLPALLGLAMAVWIVLGLAGVALPEQVLTFNSDQLKATWGIAAAGIMLSWITTDFDKGVGYWLMLLGSLAMAVGAVMALLGKGTETVDIPGGSKDTASATSSEASSTPPPPPPATDA